MTHDVDYGRITKMLLIPLGVITLVLIVAFVIWPVVFRPKAPDLLKDSPRKNIPTVGELRQQ